MAAAGRVRRAITMVVIVGECIVTYVTASVQEIGDRMNVYIDSKRIEVIGNVEMMAKKIGFRYCFIAPSLFHSPQRMFLHVI
jgi:hypothetical protein